MALDATAIVAAQLKRKPVRQRVTMVDVFWIGWVVLLLAVSAPFVFRWVRRISRRSPDVVIDRRWLGHRARIFMYGYAALFALAGFGLLLVQPDVEGGPIELGFVALGMAIVGLWIVGISHMMALRADEEGIVASHAIIPWNEVRGLEFSPGLGLKVETVGKIPLMRRWNADPNTCEFSALAFDLDETKVEKLLNLYRRYGEASPKSAASLA